VSFSMARVFFFSLVAASYAFSSSTTCFASPFPRGISSLLRRLADVCSQSPWCACSGWVVGGIVVQPFTDTIFARLSSPLENLGLSNLFIIFVLKCVMGAFRSRTPASTENRSLFLAHTNSLTHKQTHTYTETRERE
jgi:hypothetical protein